MLAKRLLVIALPLCERAHKNELNTRHNNLCRNYLVFILLSARTDNNFCLHSPKIMKN